MVTAVDSSVLLDVLVKDPVYLPKSKAALQRAQAEGSLIISETALAEISPALSPMRLEETLDDWNLVFIPASRESAILAGQMYATYLKRGGRRERVVPDFLVGAHAQVHAFRLLARDHGFYRDYFKNLKVWDPSVS